MKLNKTEVVKIMQRIAKEKGFDLTQGDIKEIIDIIDETIVKVGEQLEVVKHLGKVELVNLHYLEEMKNGLLRIKKY